MTLRVAIQEQLRLFRESLALLLQAEADLEVVGTAADGRELVDLAGATEPDAVLLQVDVDGWDLAGLVAALRRRTPAPAVIGLYDHDRSPAVARAAQAGVGRLVSRADGVLPILDALRSPVPAPAGRARRSGEGDGGRRLRPLLTPREIEVLQLISDGRNAREISAALAISPRTVENHKQRVFHKLAVQNQAHAVAVALRRGLLAPDGLNSTRPA